MGAHAIAGGLAAELRERISPTVAEALWARAEDLTPEPATPWQGALNQQPVPGTATELVAQLAPAVIANPGDTALSVALLALLADLWPHVASEERPLLRVRFYNGLMERAAAVGTRAGLPREAVVTTAELKVWTRYMPTATGGSEGAAALQRMLTAATGQEAYHQFADHLIGGIDAATIARILGSLAVQLVDQREDPQGLLLHLVVGAVAAERLKPYCPPDQLPSLLAQLAHQIWWTAARSGLAKRSDSLTPGDLAAAIGGGNSGQARRLARTQRLDEEAWWDLLRPSLIALADRGPLATRRAIIAAWTLAARSGNRLVAPDDAGAIAAMLADGMRFA